MESQGAIYVFYRFLRSSMNVFQVSKAGILTPKYVAKTYDLGAQSQSVINLMFKNFKNESNSLNVRNKN